MAITPIREIVETIKLVKTMQANLDSLVDVVEKLGARVEQLERDRGAAAHPRP